MDEKTIQNAEKLAYLIKEYPAQKVAEVIKLIHLPSIDINAAIWAAVDLGLIRQPDEKTGFAEFLKAPVEWDFGSDERHLENLIMYCLKKRAEKEQDIEEFFLTTWAMGYGPHDLLIATKRLLERKEIASYDIEDKTNKKAPSTYTFFTLYGNSEQLWGRKAFKKDPLADQDQK